MCWFWLLLDAVRVVLLLGKPLGHCVPDLLLGQLRKVLFGFQKGDLLLQELVRLEQPLVRGVLLVAHSIVLSLPLCDLFLQRNVFFLELLLFVLERHNFAYHARAHAQLGKLLQRLGHQGNKLEPAVALAEVVVLDDLHEVTVCLLEVGGVLLLGAVLGVSLLASLDLNLQGVVSVEPVLFHLVSMFLEELVRLLELRYLVVLVPDVLELSVHLVLQLLVSLQQIGVQLLKLAKLLALGSINWAGVGRRRVLHFGDGNWFDTAWLGKHSEIFLELLDFSMQFLVLLDQLLYSFALEVELAIG